MVKTTHSCSSEDEDSISEAKRFFFHLSQHHLIQANLALNNGINLTGLIVGRLIPHTAVCKG